MTITLPSDLADLLSREARRRRASVSELARQLIATGLKMTAKRPREIPWAGLFEDPEVSGQSLRRALTEEWADDVDRDRG